MLAARGGFLERGHYAPLVDELIGALDAATGRQEASVASAGTAGARGLRILDAGCGTGHYLHAVLDRMPGTIGLAADLSPAAVTIAVRGRRDVDGLVADTWAALPLRDGVADVILDVFAPRNLPEFHRVLPPGGHVAIVAAGPRHLEELRAEGRAVGVQEDKRERILESADPLFEPVSEAHVQRVLQLSDVDVDLLLGMGPSAHHPAGPDAVDTPSPVDRGAGAIGTRQGVTIDVMIHVLRRRERSIPA
ncbi:23S rRNA (guanine745-N1)-methyltransferase [Clavibacter michiganensis]|nr:methyltransferase domain-containing protein [Clavibacter michiganensis]MBP2458555.1 23S rRNA (guanine745-N1)-methyltransferase [Clavibacter michiganensis]MDQ0411126.1 23S rRNA (guanine745-N1)-methyltransferase [Clavibacter michiganensis]